jgi:hypothetical protein
MTMYRREILKGKAPPKVAEKLGFRIQVKLVCASTIGQ